MDNVTRRDREMAYRADEAVFQEMNVTRRLLWEYNRTDSTDFEKLGELMAKLIPNAKSAPWFAQPFHCDYGTNIYLGKNFGANYNCTILDVGRVDIGDNVLFGPNVAVYTAGHPIHPVSRRSAYEYGIPVKIGNDVWVGGNSVILPGVTIGDNAVIGAGSVVTKDIPANTVAAGNPCRVIREITEEDKKYFYKDREFDAEAWEYIKNMPEQ